MYQYKYNPEDDEPSGDPPVDDGPEDTWGGWRSDRLRRAMRDRARLAHRYQTMLAVCTTPEEVAHAVAQRDYNLRRWGELWAASEKAKPC